MERDDYGQRWCLPKSRRRMGPTPCEEPCHRATPRGVEGKGGGRRCYCYHLMKGQNPRSGLCRPKTGEGVTVVDSDDVGGERRRHCRARPR